MQLSKIISGGQTGVDRAALDVALAFGVPCGGWCPRGRLAEDGVIDARYPLRETPSRNYTQRTEWNVRDADGALLLPCGAPTGGTLFTRECAERLQKPYYVMELTSLENVAECVAWIAQYHIRVLNIAGPRESAQPGVVYESARRMITLLVQRAR